MNKEFHKESYFDYYYKVWYQFKDKTSDIFERLANGSLMELELEYDGEFYFYRYFPHKCQEEPPCNTV